MTPKEKANELVQKFLLEVRGADRYNYNLEDMNIFIAKQCALITAEEIIKQNVSTPADYGASWAFWMQVKEEIKELK